MIDVDISEIWGQISLQDLLAVEKDVFAAHMALNGEENPVNAWMQRPTKTELDRIRAVAEKIRFDSEVCVVVGSDGAALGARAAIELVQGHQRNLSRSVEGPRVYFAGNDLSSRAWRELTGLLEGKDFSLVLTSGAEPEAAAAFRALRWLLERKYGTEEANARICVMTGPEDALGQAARERDWEQFDCSGDVVGPSSILTAAGLLPMAVAGIDIGQILEGAAQAQAEYDLRSFENPVWLYAAVRNLMAQSGKAAELLACWEPGTRAFGSWWQQLFAGAEGENGRGMLPVAAEYPRDQYGLGQMARQGNLFETMVRFEEPETQSAVMQDVLDPEGLNDLAGKTLEQLAEAAFRAAVETHVDGGVPVLSIRCGPPEERTFGELVWFMELACALYSGMLGADPWARPGLARYRETLNGMLGR